MNRYLEDFISEQLLTREQEFNYLSDCLEEGPEVFLVALRDVAKARGGMAKLAEETNLTREALYRMLSNEGNPTFSSISSIIEALGLKLELTSKMEGEEAA
jgi:probable addiction module antidote protein